MFKKFTSIVFSLLLVALFANNIAQADVDIEKVRATLPKLLGANNAGTEFVFGFHPCWEEFGANNALRIYVSSPVVTQVSLTIPYFSQEPYLIKTTKPNDIIEFVLAPAVGQPYTRGSGGQVATLKPTQVWPGRGIILKADAPIIAYGVTRYQYTSDGFLAVPTHALSKTYIISSYRETANFTSQSLTPYADIIGVFDKTRVTFHIGGNNSTTVRTIDDKKWRPYDVLRADLNRGDFWLIASEGPQSDIGGSYVTANKPIAVLSGSHCAYIPTTISACDFIIEQELPVIAWGKKYHITNIVDRKKASVIRMFAKEPNTGFVRNGGNEIGYLTLNFGIEGEGWLETRHDPDTNKPAVITSNKAINVVQYNQGMSDDNVPSDPFQLMLTPEEQFQNEIIFNTPGIRGGYGFRKNYINIVYKSDSSGQIPDDLMLGEVFPTGETKWTKVRDISGAPGAVFIDPDQFDKKEKYYSKTIQLPYDAVYRLKVESQKIAAYAYGFADWDSYGFPTSIALADLEKPDTVCPIPVYQIFCDGSTFNPKNGKNTGIVMDMPDDDTIRTNLAIVIFHRNESFNYLFEYDDFIPGETRTIKWSLKTIDPNQDARALITFADRAGNDTTIKIDYNAIKLSITPRTFYYGNMKIGDSKTQNFVVKNDSKTSAAVLTELSLQSFKYNLESQGFKLNIPDDFLLEPLPPGQTRQFSATFTATKEGEFRDSIGVGDTCFYQFKTLIRASVGTPIINVTDVDFGKKTVGFKTSPMISTITNTGTTSLAITGYQTNKLSVFTHDLPEITPDNPLIIDKGGSYQFNVWFEPDAVKLYEDEIVFISDAKERDPICIITGEGIEPMLEATGDNWGRKRVHLTRYDDPTSIYKFTPYPSPNGAIELRNDGSKDVSISKINIVENVNGDAFEIMINGKLEPITKYINSLGLIRDKDNKSITVIEQKGYRQIPVFFHPKTEGEHKLVLEYESDAPVKPTSILEGIGIYPKISTVDLDFGTKVIGDAPAKRTLRYVNEIWDYADQVEIAQLVNQPNGTITAKIGTYGTEGFNYDGDAIRLDMAGIATFPVKLNPGQFIELDCEFKPSKTGNAQAILTTLSDAAAEAPSNWKGFGIAEGLEMVEGNEPYICYNTTDEIKVLLRNTGSSSVNVLPNEVKIINDPNNVFVIDRVTRADLSQINYANGFDLASGETVNIFVKYVPKTWKQVNIQELHEASVQVKTDAVTPSLQTLTAGVKGRAIHFTRTSESKINGVSQVTVDPGQDPKSKPITYSVYINQGTLLDVANPTEFTVTMKYVKNFLAIREENSKLLINVGADMPAGWSVKSTKLSIDKVTNEETVVIVLTGMTPLKKVERTELVRVEFISWLPWYTNEQGQVQVKGKTIDINHTIATNEQCVDYINPVGSKATLSEVCVDNLRPIVISAADYNLGAINPNPVTANGTDIPFSIAFDGFVEIRIVNAAGNVIDIPVSGDMKAGAYSIRLPIEKLANGAYILEMVSGEFRETRKFNVVK